MRILHYAPEPGEFDGVPPKAAELIAERRRELRGVAERELGDPNYQYDDSEVEFMVVEGPEDFAEGSELPFDTSDEGLERLGFDFAEYHGVPLRADAFWEAAYMTSDSGGPTILIPDEEWVPKPVLEALRSSAEDFERVHGEPEDAEQ